MLELLHRSEVLQAAKAKASQQYHGLETHCRLIDRQICDMLASHGGSLDIPMGDGFMHCHLEDVRIGVEPLSRYWRVTHHDGSSPDTFDRERRHFPASYIAPERLLPSLGIRRGVSVNASAFAVRAG
jgi:hypothetical protein